MKLDVISHETTRKVHGPAEKCCLVFRGIQTALRVKDREEVESAHSCEVNGREPLFIYEAPSFAK